MCEDEGESVFGHLFTHVAQMRRLLVLSAAQTGSDEVGCTAAADLEALDVHGKQKNGIVVVEVAKDCCFCSVITSSGYSPRSAHQYSPPLYPSKYVCPVHAHMWLKW